MNSQKTARSWMELRKSTVDQPLTVTSPQDPTRETFARFVDQNPLFSNHTKDAIRQYIHQRHKKRFFYASHLDEVSETGLHYFITNRIP